MPAGQPGRARQDELGASTAYDWSMFSQGVHTSDASRIALRHADPAARIQLMAGMNQVKLSPNFAKLAGVESIAQRIQHEALRPITEMHTSLAATLAATQPKVALRSQFQQGLQRDFTGPLFDQVREIYTAPLRDALASVHKMQAAQFEPIRRILDDVARPVTTPHHDWFSTLDLSTALIRPAPSPLPVQRLAPVRGLADFTVTDEVLRFLDAVGRRDENEVEVLRAEAASVCAALVGGDMSQDLTVAFGSGSFSFAGLHVLGAVEADPHLSFLLSAGVSLSTVLMFQWARGWLRDRK